MLSNSKNIFQENSADRGAFLMQLLKLDGPLLFLISLISLIGIFVLYSASNESTEVLTRQLFRIMIAFIALIITSQL